MDESQVKTHISQKKHDIKDGTPSDDNLLGKMEWRATMGLISTDRNIQIKEPTAHIL